MQRFFSKRFIRFLKFAIIFIIVLAFILAIFSHIRNNMVPVFVNTCDAEVEAIAINAINNASQTILTNDIKYSDLFNIEKNDNGDITLIEARSIEINKLARELARLTQRNLESVEDSEIGVPIGTLTGMTMFIGMGPQVKISISPIGVANCDFVSEFVSAGINQTVHKIYANISVTITVAIPIADISVDTSSEVLICENLIIGKVPDTYLTIGRITEGLNLVP